METRVKDNFDNPDFFIRYDSTDYLHVKDMITFQNCIFQGDLKPFEGIYFEGGLIINESSSTESGVFTIQDIYADKLTMNIIPTPDGNKQHPLSISKCNFPNGLDLNLTTFGQLEIVNTNIENTFWVYHGGEDLNIFISNCNFTLDDRGMFGDRSRKDSLHLILPYTDFTINNASSNSIGELIIDDCNFYSTGYAFFNITGNIGDLVITDNIFRTSLEIDCDIE